MAVSLAVYRKETPVSPADLNEYLERIPIFQGRALRGQFRYRDYDRPPLKLTLFQLDAHQVQEDLFFLLVFLDPSPLPSLTEWTDLIKSEVEFWQSWVGQASLESHRVPNNQVVLLQLKGDLSQLENLVYNGLADTHLLDKPSWLCVAN